MKNVHLPLHVTGESHELSVAPHATLLEVLRETMRLTGVKHGCELGECGACAVLVDDKPVLSCLKLALECEGSEIRTIEGLADGAELHPLQAAFADLGGAQCGYCTPALILTATALVEENANPSRDEISEALSGNICRCTGYLQVLDAVELAVKVLSERKAGEAAS